MTRVKIYDTTLRDGCQSADVDMSIEDKMGIILALDEFGVDYIEAGWPRPESSDEMLFKILSTDPFNGVGLKHAKIAAFGSTRKIKNHIEEDPLTRSLIESRADVATIFGKTWLHHVEQQLRATPYENLDAIGDTVRWLKENPIHAFQEVVYDAEHFFDGFKDVDLYALSTLKTARDAGADVLVLCDTNGGTPYWEIEQIVRLVRDNVPGVEIGIHAHNDSEMAVANSLAAVRAGATHVQGTINGLGERIGNANLTSIMPDLFFKMGSELSEQVDLTQLESLSRKVYLAAGLHPQDNLPFVGRKAFTHDGGVHVDAVEKGASYEHINPSSVGSKQRITLSSSSGKASVRAILRSFGYDISKDDSRLDDLLGEVQELASQGYDLGLFEDEQYRLVVKHFEDISDLPHVKVVRRTTSSRYRQNGSIDKLCECAIVLDVNGDEYSGVSDTDGGPVDATFTAFAKAMQTSGNPLDFRLITYNNRAQKVTEDGTGARVQVEATYEMHDGRTFTLVGVDEDSISASVETIRKAVLYSAAVKKFGAEY